MKTDALEIILGIWFVLCFLTLCFNIFELFLIICGLGFAISCLFVCYPNFDDFIKNLILKYFKNGKEN